MRHNAVTKKFGVDASHRKAMMRSMATSLIKHGKIETTLPRARELRKVVDRLVTLSKRQGTEAQKLHAIRQASSVIRGHDVVSKLFKEIGPKYVNRPGGYTRVTKTRVRAGDTADMAVIELV